jgi:hypothetical protein
MALLAGCGGGSGGDESTRTEISTNAISFTAAGPDVATPPSQVITATFGSEIAHLAVVHSGTAVNTVTSTLNGRTATITVEPVSPATVGPGAFIGAVAVTGYTCADSTCSKLAAGTTSTVSVSYQISPVVQLVTPYVETANDSGDVVIRGLGFRSFNVTGVSFGDTPAASFTLVNGTASDIRAVHPALPAGSYPVRLIASNFQGEITTTATLVVVDPPAFAATTLAYPAGGLDTVRKLVYDAERRALLVVSDSGGGAIARYQYSGSAWDAPIVQTAGFRDMVLSTQGTSLYSVTSTSLVPVDPVTLATGTAVAAPSLNTDAFLKNIVVGNDDVALITSGLNGTAQSNSYFYFPAVNSMGSTGNPQVEATPVYNGLGTLAYLIFGHPTLTGDQVLQRYSVLSGQFVNSSISHRQTRLGLAISRNGNRIVVNGARVYSDTEFLLGSLPDTTAAIALKPDGTRAYTYDPTAGGVLVFDISVNRDGAAYAPLGAPVPLAGDPGSNPRMIISPDGGTLFLAGGQQIVVQPTPAL